MPQTVLVTGSSRGLGLEFVRQLAARGDHVIATAREPSKTPELARLAKRIIPLDVADVKAIRAVAADLAGTPIDVLINNAGVIEEDKVFGKLSLDAFRRVFDTNVFAPALLAQALLPSLRQGKRKLIANISSELGSITEGTAGFSYAYNASKAALNRITVQMSKDLGDEGFIVMTFCPGWNRTDMGGAAAPLDPKESIGKLLGTMDRLRASDSGKYMRIDGSIIPW